MTLLPFSKINQLRFFILIVGLLGVTSIALNSLELLPMSEMALYVVLPAYILMITIGIQFPSIGRFILKGFIYGLLAVALYDMSRFPFLLHGWNDFIPNIGKWLLNSDEANGFIGYLWRYLLNGGGLGISFMMLIRLFNIRKWYMAIGLLYGIAVFLGLVATLIIAPKGDFYLFEITSLSFTGGLIGHIVYGLTLGYFTKKNGANGNRFKTTQNNRLELA